jgi:hypothetical protein
MGDNQEDTFRPGPLAGDAAYRMGGTGTLTNRIQSMLANGFQIGSNAEVNEGGKSFYWIAFDVTAKVVTGTYTGNGADDRNITGLGLTPSVVWAKRSGNNQSSWRSDAMAGDTSAYWGGTSPNPDRIQSLLADGFQIGSNAQINSNNQTYYYLALAP